MTDWPAKPDTSKVTCVQTWVLLSMRASGVARIVVPVVSRMYTSCQSKVIESPWGLYGRYQKLRVEEPAGMVTICDRMLSPSGSAGAPTLPSSAEYVPECACAVLMTGVGLPPP